MCKAIAPIFFAISLAWGQSARAEAEVDIYPYTSGFHYGAADLKVRGSTVAQSDRSIVQEVTPHMVPECVVETPTFQSTGAGTINVELSIKRIYEGALRNGEALANKPLASLRFERVGRAGREVEHQTISLAPLQRRMREEEFVRTGTLRYIRAEDRDFQQLSVNFRNDADFRDATISLCDVYFNTGFELQSLRITVIQ